MKKFILPLTIISLLLSSGIHSQVTIGSGTPPVKGALLDLKDGTPDPSSIGITASKGLGMPRVTMTTTTPVIGSLAASINGTGNWDEAVHIGLAVYNTNPPVFDPATCKTIGAPVGLYVWDGSQWQGIGTKEEEAGTADPGEGIVGGKLIDREGNDYHIATFGTAGTWMTENLRTKTAPGLATMTESAAQSTANMYYAYPQVERTYVPGQPDTWTAQQGLLYNWAATMNKRTCATDQGQVAGATPGPNEVETTDGFIQGICPFDWHVPSDREWNQLEAEIATKTSLYTQTPLANGTWTDAWETVKNFRGTTHGRAMKSKIGVNATNPNGDSKTSDAGGVYLLLTGSVFGGTAYNLGRYGYLWSSSSSIGADAWYRYIYSNNAGVNRAAGDSSGLFSVRCKKN